MTQSSETHLTDIAIIGAGPVGLFMIFQAGMLKMQAHVIDALDFIGGQCQALYPEKPIYDIPALPEIEAQGLIANLEEQAAPFNPVYHLGSRVEKCIKQENDLFCLVTSKGVKIQAKAVVIAAGCGAFGPNRPPLNNIEQYEGKSVIYMVGKRSEFKDKNVVIAGGGDSAVDWALSLHDIAAKVYLVHRRAKFRAAPASLTRLERLAEEGKVEMVTPYQLAGLNGEGDQLTEVIVCDLDGKKRALKADFLLPFFGLSMELGPISTWGVDIANKHLSVIPSTMQTSKAGIFAIGDIVDYPGKLKLILQGFAEAAVAAHNIYPVVFPDQALHFEYSTSKGIT